MLKFETENPISTVSQLPTFKPNLEYVDGLVSLSKMREEERKTNYPKYNKLKQRLSELESQMTSEELINNHHIAFPKISEPSSTKSKYKL